MNLCARAAAPASASAPAPDRGPSQTAIAGSHCGVGHSVARRGVYAISIDPMAHSMPI